MQFHFKPGDLYVIHGCSFAAKLLHNKLVCIIGDVMHTDKIFILSSDLQILQTLHFILQTCITKNVKYTYEIK